MRLTALLLTLLLLCPACGGSSDWNDSHKTNFCEHAGEKRDTTNKISAPRWLRKSKIESNKVPQRHVYCFQQMTSLLQMTQPNAPTPNKDLTVVRATQMLTTVHDPDRTSHTVTWT